MTNFFVVTKNPRTFIIIIFSQTSHIDEVILCKVLNYLLTYFVRITACEQNKNLSKFMKSMYDRVFDGSYNNYYKSS